MAHHEPFKALAPTDWSSLDVSDLSSFFSTTFSSAQTLINSIPLPSAVAQAQRGGRGRASTDSALPQVEMNRALSGSQAPDPSSAQHAAALQKEWKEVKINPRENPLAINVYKLSAKDGKGAWFARRSVHEGLTYEKFKLGLEREFAEALKVQGAPGAGNVRGIGAERKVEHEVVDGAGKAEVYQLSAQFPGPTTPRDFVTLLLSTAGSGKTSKVKLPRQFMVVSKPCIHPSCPQRSNFIRGQYESVEIIREIPIEKPLRRTRSSIDISRGEARPLREENEDITKEAILRSAQKVAEAVEDKKGRGKRGLSVSFDARSEVNINEDSEQIETAIEWLMVTRSDPGGSVPRFMVEKGTPGGIVSDAGRLLKWLEAKNPQDFEESEDNDFKKEAVAAEKAQHKDKDPARTTDSATKNLVPDPEARAADAAPSGFYGMIAGALEAAGSVVASKIFSGSAQATDSDPDLDAGSDSDDQSSIHSFASAVEGPDGQDQSSIDNATPDMSSIHSTKSDESKVVSTTATQHERDLKKLQERRRKVQEKIAKMQERALAKKSEDKDKDTQEVSKLKEKHEREIAKQEEKYQRELTKLEQKKIQEERKAEERRKKQIQREEKANMSLELERVKAERDVALKQIEVLKEQIGALQSQNTMLVAKLGKNGLLTEDDFKKGGAAAVN